MTNDIITDKVWINLTPIENWSLALSKEKWSVAHIAGRYYGTKPSPAQKGAITKALRRAQFKEKLFQ